MRYALPVSIGLVMLLCGAASAATITQTKTFTGIPDYNRDLSFNQFNTALGTLQSIKVTLTLNVNGGQFVLDNDGEDPASGTFSFGGKASITSTDVSLLNGSFQPVTGLISAGHTQSFNLAGNTGDGAGDFNSAAPDGLLYNGGLETGSSSGFVGNAVWAGYTGPGSYLIKVNATQWSDYGGVSGIEYAVSPVTASGNVKVEYFYEAIPEPVTMSLLGLGGLAMLLKRRR